MCLLTREETKEEQNNRTEYVKKNQQFTEEGRRTKITVALVLRARVKLSDNKVNGPEDAIVDEMIKKLPLEKIYVGREVLPRKIHRPDGIPKLMEGSEVGFF